MLANSTLRSEKSGLFNTSEHLKRIVVCTKYVSKLFLSMHIHENDM